MKGQAPQSSTIAGLAPLLASGALTAEALVLACLARIAEDDAGLSAIRCIDPAAQAIARSLDRDRARGIAPGKLHGIPIVVKDNIDMAGLPTTSGSRAMAGAMPLRDAEQVRRLRAAGAVILGKTNMSEFSFEIRSRSSLGGDVRNPFDRAVTAGGSSGGTAAAIAAGYAVAGLGTDTGGSIRTPASFNGLVGLRPTHGLIDARGTAPLAPPTDTVAPIASCVEDIAILLGVMTDLPPSHWLATREPGPLPTARLGVARQAFGRDAEIGGAMSRALARMAQAGATILDPVHLGSDLLPDGRPHIVDWAFRPAFDDYLAANFVAGTAPASVAAILAGGDFLPEYRAVMTRRQAAGGLDAPEYRAILADHARLRHALLALFDDCALDALVYPTSAVIPSSLDNPLGGWAPELAACSGFPAVTLPVGRAAGGIPIGLEMLGRPGGEPVLLGLAYALETMQLVCTDFL